MARLHNRYSSDTEAAAFHALALLEAVDLTDKKYSKQLKAAEFSNGCRRRSLSIRARFIT
jgi:hypothetical protein